MIEWGAVERAGALTREALGLCESRDMRVAIITDDIVDALHLGALTLSLERAHFTVCKHVMKHGEKSKSVDEYARVLAFLANNRVTRSDCVCALGGGVVGDLAGFAAATYMRGVPLINVPTTLLACVDSAIGGKCALDLPRFKNIAGAFYNARLTLIDPRTLSTLPEEQFLNGAAEALKYAAIADAGILSLLNDARANLNELIRRCVGVKRDIVARDPYDMGERQLLNFGHTFGHAVECYTDYTISHGRAVAIGMAVMARACASNGICAREDALTLLNALNSLGLPDALDVINCASDKLLEHIEFDKKRAGGDISLVVMRAFGRCERLRMPMSDARALLASGCAKWR